MAQECVVCKNCGRTVDIYHFSGKYSLAQRIRQEQLCFDCLFWKDIIQNRPENTVVIDDGLWEYHPSADDFHKPDIRNTDYKCIYNPETRALRHSLRYRLIGRIPKRFAADFPTEFRSVANEMYYRLQTYWCAQCNCKGCWDRYHCVWYDAAVMEPEGPWNRIPKSHVPGDEKCERFINKFTMYDNT